MREKSSTRLLTNCLFAQLQAASHWIQFKVNSAFQWMSPVNQGNYFEGLKGLEGLSKTGWADEDAQRHITT